MASGAASIRVWEMTSRGARPGTGRPPPDGVGVDCSPARGQSQQQLGSADGMAFPNSLKEARVEPEASSPQTATQRDVEVSRLREEVDKMKAAYYDLREKLATLKETDITKVKEELHEFSLKLKVWAIIGSAIVALAAGLGVKQYRDLNDL